LLLTNSASCATRFSRDETTNATRKAKCEVATRGKGKTKKKKKKNVSSVGEWDSLVGRGGMRNTVHLILYTDKQHIRIRIGAIYLGKNTERSKESPFSFPEIFLFLFIEFFLFNNKYYSKF
jgi:hypothetical protein